MEGEGQLRDHERVKSSGQFWDRRREEREVGPYIQWNLLRLKPAILSLVERLEARGMTASFFFLRTVSWGERGRIQMLAFESVGALSGIRTVLRGQLYPLTTHCTHVTAQLHLRKGLPRCRILHDVIKILREIKNSTWELTVIPAAM